MTCIHIAAVDGGTYYHRATLEDARFAPYFATRVYAPELATCDEWLDADCLFVASRQDPRWLQAAASRILAFLEAGKTVVALGESAAHTWLPGVDWHPAEVNFWWWLTRGADSGLRVASPQHRLFEFMALADATWHQHGYLLPPPGAESLIDRSAGGSVLYEDRVSTRGRLLVSTLDPCYHHGSNFMPAATRFLQGFLPWLTASLAANTTRAPAQATS